MTLGECDGCGEPVDVGDEFALVVDLSGRRDSCIGEFCDECAERLAGGDFSLEVGKR